MSATPVRVSLAESFLPSLDRLEAIESRRVLKAVQQFTKNPDHSSLNLHPVQSDNAERLFTIRASDDLRVLLTRLDESAWVVQEAGHHDAIYLRAGLGKFVVAADGSSLGFFSPADAAPIEHGAISPASRLAGDQPMVLAHWTDSELGFVGFSEVEIALIRECPTPAELLDLDIDEELILLAIDLIELTPESYKARSEAGDQPRATGDELIDAVERDGAAWGLSQFLEQDEMERLLADSIEKWMLFLHPKQRSLVTRAFEGPARIGGPAGTGKTVVALHRAAALAQRFRAEDPSATILFTTYIKSLSPVFESLYNRLPNAIPGAVEFVNVDSLANAICREARVRNTIKNDMVKQCFEQAFAEVVAGDTPLGRMSIDAAYLKEEIDAVIKGRALGTPDAYLELDRTGRRTPLLPQHREQVWKLRVRFDELMANHGTIDFSDRTLLALDYANTQPGRYRAAIIDEAQDLSLASLQLIRRLVNGDLPDRPDGLLLVGDGAQRIYPSCFTLRQAGLEVRGRSTILERNYRNTTEILAAAMAVAGDRDIDDLGEQRKRASAVGSALPSGDAPRLVTVETRDDASDYVVARVHEITERGRAGLSDIAVLAPTNQAVKSTISHLSRAGLLASDLKDYAPGRVNQPTVRVGTYWRAKGLEFKAVILLGLERFPMPQKNGEADTAYEERLDLEVSALYVAMTRARDLLDLVAVGAPTLVVAAAADHFEQHSVTS